MKIGAGMMTFLKTSVYGHTLIFTVKWVIYLIHARTIA